MHIDIDPSEINKNKEAHIPIVSDIKYALAELNKIVEAPEDLSAWHAQIAAWKKSDPFQLRQERQHDLCRSTRSTSCGS